MVKPVQFTSTAKGPYTVTATVEDVTQTVGINGKGDFDILQEMVNNESLSVINLERDYIFNEFDSMTDGVIITRNITINGNGHIIDAKGKSRILNVKANNVTIINITFINGMAPPNKDGGAIYWDHADYGNISGCSFVNNSATNRGGAIYWSNANYTSVSDCSFVNNSATTRGGALYWFDGDYASVSGCSFVDNSADDTGGDLYLNGVDYASVSGSSFVGNSADNDGGAICWAAEYGSVSDCIFEDNFATNHEGVIWFNGDHGRISGCIFVNNSANKGIVYFYDYFSVNLTVNNNIFLDNDVSAVDFLKEDSTSNVNYNWFGHNATDYNVNPNLPSCTVWLFLNATATSDTLAPSETSEIIFKLYAYDSNSQDVAEYDNALFNNINLTVTSTGGSVDKRVVKLNENIKFTPTEIGIGSVTAEFENAMYTIVIDIRIDPNLSFGPQEVIYSNSTLIAVSYNSTATGKLNITLIGKKSNYLFIDLDLNETVQLGDIGADEYEVTVKYSGDYNFASSTVTGTLTVNKADSSVILNNVEFDEGEHIIIIAITEGAEGVTAKIDGNNVDVINNVILVPERLDNGNHTLEVTTIPDKNHNSVNTTVTISVGGRESADVNVTIPSDIPIGDDATIKIDIPDATGNVTVYVDGGEYVAELVNGSANVTIPGLSGGNHTVVVEYSGDDKYAPFTKVVTLNVPKADIPVDELKVNVALPIGGKLPTVTIKLPEDITSYVLVRINGYDYYLDVNNGTATIKLPALSYGKHNVDVTYPGDDKYNAVSKNITVNIPKPVINAKNVVYRYTYKGPYEVRVLVDGKAVIGQYVTFTFNGKTYKRLTNSKGYALFNVPTVKPKAYKITAKYNDISISKKIKISNIIVVKTKKIKKSSKKVKIKVKLKTVKNKYLKSKKLTLKIKGKNIKAKTNKKGIAIFKLKKSIVKKLKVGKRYKVKVSYGKDIITKKIKILR